MERSGGEILPFTDGVLELATGQFHPHAPGHRLTWCLPRPYNAVSQEWTKIGAWLDEATGGDHQHRETLLCFAAAVLRGRVDLHKFLYLIGVGGTGKSTFTRLLEALIGSQNCWNGSLKDLEDKHEIVQLVGKRLVILPDQDKVTGSLSNFKRLTGQDTLSGRRLYKDGINFRFPGMVVVTSNAPVFHADGGSWLTRRIVMVPFDHKPAVTKLRDLEAEFEPELSAFTARMHQRDSGTFWYAYRKIGGKLKNAYLGKSENLTAERMLEIAARLGNGYTRECINTNKLGKLMPNPCITEEMDRLKTDLQNLKTENIILQKRLEDAQISLEPERQLSKSLIQQKIQWTDCQVLRSRLSSLLSKVDEKRSGYRANSFSQGITELRKLIEEVK